MKEISHYSDAAAPAVYDETTLSTDGKIDRQAVKNVVDFMVQYDLIKATDVPNDRCALYRSVREIVRGGARCCRQPRTSS